VQDGLSLLTFGALLLNFSLWAVLILVLAAIPAFVAETRLRVSFPLVSVAGPETREQHYLETLIAREDSAMEVKLFQLGNTLLARYKSIFDRLYTEDRA
jgi:ATP-binding cassette subfamily B protein/ATP-binding cassette subfamily C protein